MDILCSDLRRGRMRRSHTIGTVTISGQQAESLGRLGSKAPKEISYIGALELLDRQCLGLLCSARCSGNAILAAYEVSKKLDPAGMPVLGGFHSPMEKQFLEILLVRHVPAVVCVPRPLSGMRIPACWGTPLAEGCLLVLSPITSGNRRFSRHMAELRNAIVAALADPLFIPCASAGGSTEKLLAVCAGWGKTILTVSCNDQPALMAAGAGSIEEWLLERGTVARAKRLVLL
jgi:hypothetical protein